MSVDGLQLMVPPGALDRPVALTLAEASIANAPPFPDSRFRAVSPLWAAMPHGTSFALPVQIQIRHDAAPPEELRVLRLDDESDTTWEELTGLTNAGGIASFEQTHFSLFQVVASTSVLDQGVPTDAGGAPFEDTIIFVNRCVGGCTYRPGANDPAGNTTSLVASAGTLTAFEHADAVFVDTVDCMRDALAPFHVTITTVEPTHGDYMEIVLAGAPNELGFSNGVALVAPFTCTPGVPFEGDVALYGPAFVFANQAEQSAFDLCWSGAQAVGQLAGLDHHFACADVMSVIPGCSSKTFIDSDVPCGSTEARACTCGASTENSFERMAALFGADEVSSPPDAGLDAGPLDVGVTPDAGPPAPFAGTTIFVDRCLGGCTYGPGMNDPAANTSSVLQDPGVLAAFEHGDTVFNDTVQCLRDLLAPFDLSVTTVEPSSGDYLEIALGGEPPQLGFPNGTALVAPFTCTPTVPFEGDLAIYGPAFVFANLFGADVPDLCWAAAQAVGQLAGMDYHFYCSDVMAGGGQCFPKVFQNMDMVCGRYEASPTCLCGGATENSFERMVEVFGAAP